MEPIAGPSSYIPATDRAAKVNTIRTASKSKTSKRIEQERIVDRLLELFLDETKASAAISGAAQKAKAIQVIQNDSWSPENDNEIAAAVQGLSLKHSIHLEHELSLALKRCYTELLVSCERSVRLAEQAKDAQKRHGIDFRNLPAPLIRPDNVSDAVRLLLNLSKPADVTARTAANLILNATWADRAQYLTPEQRKQAEKREWLGILVDEPLEGDAWMDDNTDQDNIDLSDWSLDSDDERRIEREDGYDSDKQIRKRRNRFTALSTALQPLAPSNAEFERRELWTRQRQLGLEALAEAASQSAIGASHAKTVPAELTEADVVRESVSVLLGCSNMLFQQISSEKVTLIPSSQHAMLSGLSEQLQDVAVLASTVASLRAFVKGTIAQSIQTVDVLTRTPAVEAFAEQLQILLERFSLRLSELDADITVASLPGHPASVHTDRYATLMQFIEITHREAATLLLLSTLLQEVGFITPDIDSGASVAGRALSDRALIDGLQALLGFVHQQYEVAHSENILADLSTCLLAACRPAWRSVCQLIRRGLSFAITRDHDHLFDDRLVQHMIRHDALLSTSDSTFWTAGYVVRRSDYENGSDEGYSPPAFLQSIMQDIVTTAKGVGLLRSLGIDALGEVQPNTDLDQILGLKCTGSSAGLNSWHDQLNGNESDIEDGRGSKVESNTPERVLLSEAQNNVRKLLFSDSASLGDLKETTQSPKVCPQTPLSQPDTEPIWSSRLGLERLSHRLIEPMLGRSLQEHLAPLSAIVRKRLIDILSSPVAEGGYALQAHLEACHGLFFMQRGAEVTTWLESLFTDLDQRNGTMRATEPHRLHSGFSDALEAHLPRNSEEAWIDTNLVRFSTGDDELESAAAIRQRPRIRRLADIQAEYEMPWPLTYVFPLGCMRFYQTIFTALLQAKYAQWKLKSTIKLAKPETVHMRKFWTLRRQAQWLVRTLIEFLQRDILLDGGQRLCTDLEGTVSIDSAIVIHNEALERMEMLCFQRVEQANVKELFLAAWRLGVEVVSTYEQYVGKSSRLEDRIARRKRRERRKKRRDKAKQNGAPLGVIAEEEKEEEDQEEEDEEEEGPEEGGLRESKLPEAIDGEDAERMPDAYGSTPVDASMSVDISSSWMESDTQRRERFRIECAHQRKALERLVEELKVSIDVQIGRIATKATAQAQDATQADRALKEHDYCRTKWQGLLYALAWSDLSY